MELSDKLETALTEQGIDAADLYQMSRSEQDALIERTMDAVVSDQELGKLNQLMGESLTQTDNRGKVDKTVGFKFEQIDVQQQYKMMQDAGVMRLPSADEFAQMQENGSREYQNLVARYQNLNRGRSWSAVEFNPEKLDDHAMRHGKGVGATTAADYANVAVAFVNDTVGKETIVSVDGIRRFYDPKTGYFASVYPDGTIATFYKPKNPSNYWEGQVRRYGTK